MLGATVDSTEQWIWSLLLKLWFGNVQRRWRWFDSLRVFPGVFFFIFLSFSFLFPPQSGAGKGKLTRSLAVCEESSARPGGESLQDQVYPPSLWIIAWTGSTFVCMSINLALNSVLGEQKTVQEGKSLLASSSVSETFNISWTVCHKVLHLFFSRPSENCKWKGIQKNLD